MIEKDYAPKQFMGQIDEIRNLQKKTAEYKEKIATDERTISKLDDQFNQIEKQKKELESHLEMLKMQAQPKEKSEKEELLDQLLKMEEEANEKKKEIEMLQLKHDELISRESQVPKRVVRGTRSQQALPTVKSNKSSIQLP